MCRHLAAVGPRLRAMDLVWTAPHSLRQQAFAPQELLSGTVCADGFGVAWYPDGAAQAARYANPVPLWADWNLETLGPAIVGSPILAAARTATVAGANTAANCAPFVQGNHAFSHNGYLGNFVEDWRDGWLRERISPQRRRAIQGTTDSEHLFAALLTRIDAGATLPAATRGLVRDVLAHARTLRQVAQLNLLVTDGTTVVATRAGTAARTNSLWLLAAGRRWPGARIVASERLDDDAGWAAVPPMSLVAIDDRVADISPLSPSP